MLSALIASLLSGLLLPLYTDEVGWRVQLSRYLQDGVDRSVGESCGTNSNAVPPLFMLPVRLFSSLATRLLDDPFAVRGCGVALAILGVVGIRLVIRRLTLDPQFRALLDMFAFALLGLGILPLLLVWSRPEQPLWLALLGSVLIALRSPPRRPAQPLASVALRVAGIVLLALIAFSYHPKGLFYLPVFAVAIVASHWHRRSFAIRGVGIAILVATAAIAYRYWSERFACPADPVLAAKMAKENLSVLLIGGHWSSLFAALPSALSNMLPHRYLFIALPNDEYMSHWLPPNAAAHPMLVAWRVLGFMAWYFGIAGAAAAGVAALLKREGQPARAVIVVALIGCSTAWAALQINKNAYESALYLPVMVLALTIALSGYAPRRWMAPAIWTLAVISLASQICLAIVYVPPLWASAKSGGYPAGQPYSVGPYRYTTLRPQILAAGARCGIGPGARRVLVDDLTYFAYAQSYRPVHRLGLLSDWNGSTSDPLYWMHRHGSSGAVLGCRYLPPAMRAQAIASGPFCCVATH